MHAEKIVRIQSDRCIGCAKCLPKCPTNAIIGSPQHMHTVIEPLCIGCGHCIAPCPTDCFVWEEKPALDALQRRQKAQLAKHQVAVRKKVQTKTLTQSPSAANIDKTHIQNTLGEILKGVL